MTHEPDLKKIPVTLSLILVNVCLFLWFFITGDPEDGAFMLSHGAASYQLIERGEIWRLFTSMFLHFSAEHLLSNMLSLFALGCIIEDRFGHGRFLFIFLLSGLFGGLASFFWHRFLLLDAVCAGASGAVFGLDGALLIMALFGSTARYGVDKRRVPLAVLLTVVLSAQQNVDNAAHIGGLLAGALLSLVLTLADRGKKDTNNVL